MNCRHFEVIKLGCEFHLILKLNINPYPFYETSSNFIDIIDFTFIKL